MEEKAPIIYQSDIDTGRAEAIQKIEDFKTSHNFSEEHAEYAKRSVRGLTDMYEAVPDTYATDNGTIRLEFLIDGDCHQFEVFSDLHVEYYGAKKENEDEI